MVPKVAGSSPVGHPTAAAPTIRPGEHQPRVLPARTDANRSSSAGARAGQPRWPVKSDRATALGRLRLSNVGLMVDHHTGPPRRDPPPGLQVDVIQRSPATSPLRMPLPSLQQSSIEGGELGRREPHRREPLLYQEPGDGSVGRLDKVPVRIAERASFRACWHGACLSRGRARRSTRYRYCHAWGRNPASALLLEGEAEQLEQPVRVGVAVGGAGWLDGLALSVSRRAGGVGARREHTGRWGRRLTTPPTKPAQPVRASGASPQPHDCWYGRALRP